MNTTSDLFQQRTTTAFLWSRVLKTPFWAIFNLLPFILYQEMGATPENPPIQIAIMIALKPMVSILSMYWSAGVSKRRDRLVSNIIWAGVLGLLPFFFFPLTGDSWFFVFAFGLYMMFHRGSIPAWMEIMKLNIPGIARKKVFAYGSAIGYIGDGILPFLFGPMLDSYFYSWRWIFPATALLSLVGVIIQYRIPIRLAENEPIITNEPPSLTKQLVKPWKDAWNLMVERQDFRSFQLGFMLGGAGLMIMQAILPAYFKGVLHLSWTELAIALTLCKGIGFAITSQSWAHWMHRVDIYRMSSVVTLVVCLFPLCLLMANLNIIWVYIAYISYGVMQAGSELSWNMSGPIFSKDEDSSFYSSVNVVTVGLRGCIFPFVGTLLLYWTNPSFVLIFGGFMCLLATITMASNSRTRGALVLEKVDG
jgi:hypothetical protein